METNLGQTPYFDRQSPPADGTAPTTSGQDTGARKSELYSGASGEDSALVATLDSSKLEKQAGAYLEAQIRTRELLAATETPPAAGLRITRDADEFHKAISEAKSASPHGAFVNLYSPDDYKKMTMILTTDGSGGVAVKNTGDIVVLGDVVSVFKHPDSTVKDLIGLVLPEAIKRGGTHLDCFNGQLPLRYAKYGFVPVAKVAFDVSQQPDGWNIKRDKQPDIIFMAFDPQAIRSDNTGINEIGPSIRNVIERLSYSTYEDAVATQRAFAEEKKKMTI